MTVILCDESSRFEVLFPAPTNLWRSSAGMVQIQLGDVVLLCPYGRAVALAREIAAQLDLVHCEDCDVLIEKAEARTGGDELTRCRVCDRRHHKTAAEIAVSHES